MSSAVAVSADRGIDRFFHLTEEAGDELQIPNVVRAHQVAPGTDQGRNTGPTSALTRSAWSSTTYPSSVRRVASADHKAGPLQPINHGRHCGCREPGAARQFSGSERPALKQLDALQVGGVDSDHAGRGGSSRRHAAWYS